MYGIPSHADRILIFDTATETASGSVPTTAAATGDFKWAGGARVGAVVCGNPVLCMLNFARAA